MSGSSTNFGDDLQSSGGSSPSFEWGVDATSRDTFEPVGFFEPNDESVEQVARTQQQYEGVDLSSGTKRNVDTNVESLEGMPAISRRKKKAKGIPKRPMNAYGIFFERERSKLLETEGDPTSPSNVNKRLSFEELEKIIGMRWRDLKPEQREELETLAAEDSVRFRNEMETFNDEKKKRKAAPPVQQIEQPVQQQQPEPPRCDPAATAPPPPQHSSMHHHTSMAMYRPPPSPSSSSSVAAAAPHIMYGHPQHPPPSPRSAGRHPYPHPHHAEHYPPSPYPPLSSHSGGHPSHAPSSHYYGPHTMLSSSLHPPPPPPPVPSQRTNREAFPPILIPPGMELLLPGFDGVEKKYKVQYACYTMTREAAQDYVDRLSNAIVHGGPPPPPPQNPRMDEESVQVAARPPAWSGTY